MGEELNQMLRTCYKLVTEFALDVFILTVQACALVNKNIFTLYNELHMF